MSKCRRKPSWLCSGLSRPPLYDLSPRSLYVHIPFCASRCFYCDFNTYVAPPAVRREYVGHLVAEFRLLRDEYFGAGARPELDTVFFGGGTPTMLADEEWSRLAGAIEDCFTLAADAEWTAEANPGGVGRESLRHLKSLGVNRVSFGAQTWNETLLQAIGRLHAADDIARAVQNARDAGIGRMNVDLMLGLPDQTLADVEDAVERVAALGLRHVSAYGLKVEEGTPFADWQRQGLLRLPDEEDDATMYERACEAFGQAGLLRYEVSNFAVPGEEARHNLVYWRNLPYLAAGAGAHGYVYGRRYENVRSLSAYAGLLARGARPVDGWRCVEPAEAMEDSMMLGLRLAAGVSRDHFRALHGMPPDAVFGAQISHLVSLGLLADDGRQLVIPPERLAAAGGIFAEFIGAAAI